MPKKNSKAVVTPEIAGGELTNSLTAFAQGVGAISPFGASQVSQADTLFSNQRWYLISNMRQLLSELYVEHGLVQTLVDQPVDDAFRSGFEVKSEHLDGNDVELLMNYLERHRIIEEIKTSCKWARLYGGGAVFPITDQDPATPLRVDSITEKTRLKFRAVDMWELYWDQVGGQINDYETALLQKERNRYYDYYGHKVHESRVLPVHGKQAPSFVRPRLRGWGMSELEKVVRNMNAYFKNQNVVFELLDEAKVDVYGIKGFNNSLINPDLTHQVTKRVQLGNQVKSFLNALVMDSEDTHEQKQMDFKGLAEILVQIRLGIAADLKMPVTKLFGMSAAGFNSGEDDIENYNAMVETEIRSKVKYIVIDVLGICCQKLFGFVPDDLTIIFNPLRILNAKEEEEVKDKKFNRLTTALREGAIEHETWAQGVNKASLLPVEVDEKAGMQLRPGDEGAKAA